MTRSTGKTLFLSVCAFLFATGLSSAQDWPQWRGPERDGRVAGFRVPARWPGELARKWSVSVGLGDSTPALVGDRLFVFSRQGASEVTRSLDAATGTELWQDRYDAQAVSGPAASHPGPRSSPTVADGKVITLGVSGILSCLEAATGKVLWRKNDFRGAWPQYFTGMSPIVSEGLCIAHLGGRSGAVVAYSLAAGAEMWRWAGDGPAYASPVLASVEGMKVIVTQTDRSVVALSFASGKLLWQVPFQPVGMGYNAATPIVDGQTLIYAGQGRPTRAVRLERAGDGLSVRELWSNPENSVQFSTPVLEGGRIYGLSQAGRFFCIDAGSGKTLWADPAGMRGPFGGIVNAGTVLIALTAPAFLTVFAPSEKGYQELARYKVASSETYAHPLVSGNRIFIKDQDAVTLWRIE